MWKKVAEILSEKSNQRDLIVENIESGALPVFMHIDRATLEHHISPDEISEIEEVGLCWMKVYPHKAVSIIRGAGPHASNFLETDPPFDPDFESQGYAYDAKPELRSIEQLYIRQSDVSALTEGKEPVNIITSGDWKMLTFVFEDDRQSFKINVTQAAILKFMLDKNEPVTTAELSKELSDKSISIIGTADENKFDFWNIFKARAKMLVTKHQGKAGQYTLSALWGKNPKQKLKTEND